MADGHGLAMAGTVDELAIFEIDADMVDAASGAEEHEITLAQIVLRHHGAGLELLPGGAGEMDAILVENPGRETGAVEPGVGVAPSGPVRRANLGRGGAQHAFEHTGLV